MSQDAAWLPSEIADQLTELKSWVRWQWLLRGAGRVGLIASLGLAGAFFADYRYDLAPTTRIAVLSSVAAITLISFLAWVVVPLCRRIGWADLAAMADKANPRWEGALTSAVELFDPTQPDGFKGSPVMREMLLKQTRQRIDELDLEEVVSSRKAWSSVRWGLASCLMLAIPVFVAPSMYRQLWQRFLMPWGNWGTAGAWTVVVENGDRIVARGTDVELLAIAEKPGVAEPPKSLTLEWRDSAGTTDRRAMPFDEARQAFVAVVPHVMRDLDYRIAVERQKSRDYKIQVVEPPVVTKIRLDVEPPAYSGWPAQSLDGAIGAIKVFEKSRLKFTLEFNKPVETAQLLWRQHGDANQKLELAASKQTASLELAADPNVAGPFLFALEDIHKLPNNDTVPRELVIVTDEAPKLTFKGDHSTEARPDDVVPIDVTASDDVGLGTLELQLTVENAPRDPVMVEAVRGQKQFEHRFTLDFSQLNVEHGQWLSYRVRITDERPEPGPHEVWSEPRVLRISKKAAPPGANELAKSHEQLKDELNDLRRDIDAKKNELADLRKETIQTKKKDAPPDGEHIAQLQRELQELTKRTEQLAEQLASDPLFHELGEKANQVAQSELTQAVAEVEKSRSDVDQKLTPEQLGHVREAEKNLEAASKKLAQLEKPFDQLADLQKDLLELRRLARQAEQLANRADELAKNESAKADASKPEAPAKDAQQPEASARDDKQAAAEAAKTEQEKQQLADQQKQLADALNDLLKRRPELLAAARRDQLEQLGELAEEAKQLAEQQKELADALRQQQAAAAERNAELAEKQQDLQQRAEAQVARSLRDRKAEESKADDPKTDDPKTDEPKQDKPAAPEALKDAVAALQQGDLAEAQKQQQQAANELDRLAAELEKAKAEAAKPNESPLGQAARELANEQKKLAEKAAEAAKSDDADARQQAAEQLNREQADLNKRIENLPNENKWADEKQKEPSGPALWVEVFDEEMKQPVDVVEYAKELGLEVPFFRGYVLEDWEDDHWRISSRRDPIALGRADTFPIRQSIKQTPMPFGLGILHALPQFGDCQVGQERKHAWSDRLTSALFPEEAGQVDATISYSVYSPRPMPNKKLEFPIGTLGNKLDAESEQSYTKLPEGRLQGLRAFVDDVRQRHPDATTPIDLAKLMIAELRKPEFKYDDKPSVHILPPVDAVDEFLKSKKGDCKQFNSTLALMLRQVRVPTRLVLGFKGGKKLEDGRFEVRWPGHAWVEAFLDGDGDGQPEWLILDATPGSGEGNGKQLAGEKAQPNPAAANDQPQPNADAKPNPAQAARQEAEQRAEQAQQALQDGDLNKAAQEQRQAEQALRELAQQAAQQPMPNAQPNAEQGNNAPMPNGNQPEQNGQPNEAMRDPAARQLAQLAEEQRQLAKEVEQARNEQRGEQPQPNAAQPPAANEQVNAKNANEPPMPGNAQQPVGENAKSDPAQDAGEQPKAGQQKSDPSNAAQPQDNSNQKPQAQPSGQKPEPQVAQQVRETQQAQQQLAQQAQQLQKQVEQELGKDSPEAKQSQQTARLCES